ncbi:MAG: response regulator [Butyrivibrio sp.]|nr:response regulator [Butyrivibrio sp.]
MTFVHLPFILLAGLTGYSIGLFAVVVVSLAAVLINIQTAHLTLIYLVIVLVAYSNLRRRWFTTLKGCIYSIVIQTLTLGNLWYVVRIVSGDTQPWEATLAGQAALFINHLPEVVIGVGICGLFAKLAPDHVKRHMWVGHYYTAEKEAPLSEELDGAWKLVRPTDRSVLGGQMKLMNVVNMMIVSLVAILLAAGMTRAVTGESAGRMAMRLSMILWTVIIPVTLFSDYIVQLRITSPIRQLSMFLKGFIATTDENRREYARSIHELPMASHSRDELGDLFNSIDAMVDQTTEYITKIKEEKNLQNELEAARAASNAKTSFLSSISHEIRTPINSVLGMDEMILRESREPEILRYAQNIREAGRALLSLISDVLDFSRIEAGRLEINPVEYDLASVVNDVINMITLSTREKGLQLYVRVEETIPHVLFGDEYRLRQCILNLMTNAVKYTKKGSVELRVASRKVQNEEPVEGVRNDEINLAVEVIDTGSGIREEDMDRLFSPFDRLDEDKNPGSVGAGLGLSIVQQLLHLMDSELHVESVYGEGSIFSFVVRQRVIDWDPIGSFNEDYDRTKVKHEEYRETFHAPQGKILVVDDTEMNLTVVKGLLKQTELTIDTAASGQEMLSMVCRKRYDIIFLDHRMPGMDGIETFHRMQSLENNLNRGVPCIALTANAISGARERYFTEGFSDYMSKPIVGEKLEKLILKYLPPELVEIVEVPSEEQTEEQRTIPEIEGIDHMKALQHCGSEAVLEKIMRQFYGLIPGKTEEIQSYWEIGDYNNFGIQVHALKSSARLIGASELSKEAEMLEHAANEHDRYYIDEHAGEFLEHYRGFYDKLSFLRTKEDDVGKPLIEESQLREVLQGMREFVMGFDFDGADDLMEMCRAYRLPMEVTPLFEELDRRLAAVDRDGLLRVLDEWVS